MRAGNNGLFVPGPTNLPPQLRRAMDRPLEDHRSPDFPNLTLGLFEDLKRVFKLDQGRVFIFPGSGTGGWEAAITNTLSPGDTVLASVFGQFSHLWVDLCQRQGLNVQVIETPGAKARRSSNTPNIWPPIRRTRSRRCWFVTTKQPPA